MLTFSSGGNSFSLAKNGCGLHPCSIFVFVPCRGSRAEGERGERNRDVLCVKRFSGKRRRRVRLSGVGKCAASPRKRAESYFGHSMPLNGTREWLSREECRMSLLHRTVVAKAVRLECKAPAEIPSTLILMLCSSLENRCGRGFPSRTVS